MRRMNNADIEQWAKVEYKHKNGGDILDVCEDVLYEVTRDMAMDLSDAINIIQELRDFIKDNSRLINAADDRVWREEYIPSRLDVLLNKTKEYL